MSRFAIRMSRYKTVNKRADPKRNFSRLQQRLRGKSNEIGAAWGKEEIEAGFGKVGENRRETWHAEERKRWREKCARNGGRGKDGKRIGK